MAVTNSVSAMRESRPGVGKFPIGNSQTIGMDDGPVALLAQGASSTTSVGSETLDSVSTPQVVVASTLLFVDAEGNAENLYLPAAADWGSRLPIMIQNTGGENVVVKDRLLNTIATLATTESGTFVTNGTSWYAQD